VEKSNEIKRVVSNSMDAAKLAQKIIQVIAMENPAMIVQALDMALRHAIVVILDTEGDFNYNKQQLVGVAEQTLEFTKSYQRGDMAKRLELYGQTITTALDEALAHSMEPGEC
jgi:hypothetical protein